MNAVARMVLNDFQRGKLPYFVKPPSATSQEVTVVHAVTTTTCNCNFMYMHIVAEKHTCMSEHTQH